MNKFDQESKGYAKSLAKILVCAVFSFAFFYVLFYQLFWTQACPEGIGTNGTHRTHARCHPYPIPHPIEVGHTTGIYDPYSFRTVVCVLTPHMNRSV